mgnify:CR=1 FL=1|jgi:hypothetical protein|tara:strand:- start:369 stop:974 length:606 start_codon:yes stop_codon:yes gene_type:complete
MAYTSKSFLKDLAIYSTGAAVGIKNTGKFVSFAAKQGIRLAAIGAPVAARTVGTLAAANPVSTGLGLGASFLASETGQGVLESAAERGARDRIRAQQAVDTWVYENITRPQEVALRTAGDQGMRGVAVRQLKKKVSKYNKAVSVGMKAVKGSTSYGKKGIITNAKKAFSMVNKVASAKKKKRKAPKSGIRRRVWNAMGRFI